MKAINVKVIRESADHNSRVVQAFIVSDTVPAQLPTTGAGIEGLMETDSFAPFSMIYVTEDADAKVYIADESGVFIPQ